MRRWLLAVFVLQLFLNMAGLSVVEPWHAPGPDHGQHASVAQTPAGTPVSTKAKGLADQVHGLMDELPDLPDTLLRPAATKALAMSTPAHTGWVHAGADDPLPDTLLRPPQRG